MLVGKLVYHSVDNKGNKRDYHYNLKGVDTSSVTSFKISSAAFDAQQILVAEEYNEDGTVKEQIDAMEERQFTVGMADVKVQATRYKNENGKNVNRPVNRDFFCRLGSLIRYAKQQCTVMNQEGYTGLKLASGEFEAVAEQTYIIPYPCQPNSTFAKVELSFGELYGMMFATDYFELELEEDEGLELELFPNIKNATKLGVAFNTEYLGFPLPEQIVETEPDSTGMYTCIEDIIKAHPDKEFSWLLGKDYRIVDDEHLQEICDYIMNYDGYVYYDTETTGLNITFKSRTGQADQLVGVVLSVKYGESFYFPLQMKSIKNLCGGDHFYVMQHYLKPILEGKKLVAHNMSYDWKVAYIYDINANIVHDTMAIIKLTIGAEKMDYPIGLKYNARVLLNRDSLELSDLIVGDSWGESDIKFWDLPYELVRLYACADTDNTNGLLQYAIQQDLLTKYNAHKVYEIEVAFSYATAYQEFYGHRINIENLGVIKKEIEQQQKEAMAEMEKICGHSFNANSSQQLQTIMFQELHIPPQVSSKTGNLTTDKKTIKKLAELEDIDGNIRYPFCKWLQEYRLAEGVRKIIDKFPEHMTEDGYVFSHVMQYGTTTGRVSVNTPNYQSYSDPVKKNVIPRPGYWMFDTDYSSVEYRVLANMVGNKRIMDSFKDPDFDYHQYQAARMYRVPYNTVDKKKRKAAKGINFGLPYGMGDMSLGETVFGERTKENARKAAALRNAYFDGQEDIRDWFEQHRSHGVKYGWAATYFGRRRYFHKQIFNEAAIRRQAGNCVIQGCLSGSSRIQTLEQGIKKIEQVSGQKLHVWDGEIWTDALILPSGKKQKCIVTFNNGMQIVCSPDHKFLVRSKRGNDRFVKCSELLSKENSKNPHRIVINTEYQKSNAKYKSDRNVTMPAQGNNVFLDDLKDSFILGQVLGRLSSDGNVDQKRGRLRQIVAEHELDVYEFLRQNMQCFNCGAKIDKLRKDRNERIAKVSVYSRTLINEICSLDIRHRIDDRIFEDTEMLRGFLSGLFDGDGGISGKIISFVQGTQEDFEPFMRDIQKALLMFGIRSRYAHYDGDRYRINIVTTDNEKFLDVIGFINKDKQAQGKALTCQRDEHIFGKCLLVESVEMTDEYIDMYDVCNTQNERFVVDGVITHNSAADIYKMAVGRVFKRVCKEGWLGKVLFSGFIHDELLGEVSNDINPGVFLKALREEFEVKIKNPDGTPWCPLYMGFGYGMSWYEAKSVELPIKLQWEFVEKYGETGFPDWDGNGRKFCDTIPDRLREFDVRDIRNQLYDKDSQGKEIKATLNKQILDCLSDDAKLYTSGIKEYLAEHNVENVDISEYLKENETDIEQYLDKKHHIQKLYSVDGNFVDSFDKGTTESGKTIFIGKVNGKEVCSFEPDNMDTQKAIDMYCVLHDTDRTKVNILSIAKVVKDAEDIDTSKLDLSLEYYDDEDEIERWKEVLNRVKVLGLYPDVENKRVYLLRNVPDVYINTIATKINKTGNGYKISFIMFDEKGNDTVIETASYLPVDEQGFIRQIYIQALQ